MTRQPAYSLVLVTAPSVEPVTLEEARLHLRLDATGSPEANPDDSRIERLIRTARAHLDGKDGWLQRAIVRQTWDLVLDAFPDGELGIRVPLPPLASVTSITYLDADGAEQTLAASAYTVDTSSEPGWIMPGDDGWPNTDDVVNAVTVRFVAGYAPVGSPPDYAAGVPDPIKDGMLLHIEALFAKNPADQDVLMQASERILYPYRIWL